MRCTSTRVCSAPILPMSCVVWTVLSNTTGGIRSISATAPPSMTRVPLPKTWWRSHLCQSAQTGPAQGKRSFFFYNPPLIDRELGCAQRDAGRREETRRRSAERRCPDPAFRALPQSGGAVPAENAVKIHPARRSMATAAATCQKSGAPSKMA